MKTGVESPFPRLFSPIKVGDLEVKNRLAFAPTGRGDCDLDGTPNDQTICGYVAIAKGGVGWVVVEHTLANLKYGKGMGRTLSIHDDLQLLVWRRLSDAIHAFDAVAVVQLNIGLGRWARRRYATEIVGASPVAGVIPVGSVPRGLKALEGFEGPVPRELTTAEVEQLADLFVAAAKRLQRAGFDGIEIHAHSYLLGQFLSADTNRRTDKYGGNVEKRLTLALNLIDKTKQACGKRDFLVGIRLSADEHYRGGRTIEETKAIIPPLVGAGLDYIHISSGCLSALNWSLPPKEGMLLEESAEIKKVSSVPVMCPNIHLPKTGEEAIVDGKADMVSLSRTLLADPNWPTKAKGGRVKDIVHCTFCNTCWVYHGWQLGIRCPENPNLGRERFMSEYWPPPVRVAPV